ncbi:hypothetical protein [Azospirillum sp. Marseille-Q6669]
MSDAICLAEWVDIYSAVREVQIGFSVSYEKAQDTVIKLISEGTVSVRGRVSISGISDRGWISNGLEFQPWTSEAATLVRPIEADSSEWRTAKIDWVGGVVRFQTSIASAVELNMAELKSWLRVMRSDAPLVMGKKEGRPEKIDWKRVYFEMIRWAGHPDGLPDEDTVKKAMIEWISREFKDPPDRKTIEDRVKEYFDYEVERRGKPFPAPR